MISITLLSVIAVVVSQRAGHSVRVINAESQVTQDQVRQWVLEEVEAEESRLADHYLQTNRKAWRDTDLLKYVRELELMATNVAMRKPEEYFPTTYKGKRFWIESRPLGISCEQARTICTVRGGHMANIYDRPHHYALMERLRLLTAYNGVMTAWTGMSYNNQTKIVSLFDGSPAPYKVIWFWTEPRPTSPCMSLASMPNRLSQEQGLRSEFPNAVKQGVICERPLNTN